MVLCLLKLLLCSGGYFSFFYFHFSVRFEHAALPDEYDDAGNDPEGPGEGAYLHVYYGESGEGCCEGSCHAAPVGEQPVLFVGRAFIETFQVGDAAVATEQAKGQRDAAPGAALCKPADAVGYEPNTGQDADAADDPIDLCGWLAEVKFFQFEYTVTRAGQVIAEEADHEQEGDIFYER